MRRPAWWDTTPPFGIRWFLGPLAGLYGGAVTVRAWAYRHHLFRVRRLPCKVVSIGNLTVGGTGKTPVSIDLAKRLHEAGWRVAVLSRGYGGREPLHPKAVSDGDRVLIEADEAGDEPRMIAERLPGIPVVIGKDRYKAGAQALQRFGSDLLILDDGFQHLAMARDCNLLLVDTVRGWGNGRLLPLGPLREGYKAIRRADAVIFTHLRETLIPERLVETIHRYAASPDIPLFACRFVAEGWIDLATGESLESARLKAAPCFALSGIATPATFVELLKQHAIRVMGTRSYPDHHAYAPSDIKQLLEVARGVGARALVTTEKDGVKLRRFLPIPFPCYALRLGVQWVGEDPLGWVRRRLGG
ncbi:MAG: tetraacyldisaccharide 4'-kinase [Nitrospirae bacterium]|nr:tetraacyldisaccharide 4'-kinase [Nitrospirota bacterium]